MALDKLGMKVAEVGFQASSVGKSGNKVGTVSDDFRNLLNSKQEGTKESQEGSQVSKDKKPEKTDEVKDEGQKDEVKDDQGKTEKPEEDSSKTDEMLAAYQASQSLRPEILKAAPETETTESVPEIAAAETGMEEGLVTEISQEIHDGAAQILAGDAKVQRADEAVKPAGNQEMNQTAENGAAVKPEENRIPFEPGRISGLRKKPNPPRARQVVSLGGQSKTLTEGNESDHVLMPAASGDVHG